MCRITAIGSYSFIHQLPSINKGIVIHVITQRYRNLEQEAEMFKGCLAMVMAAAATIVAASVVQADQGTATFYTPPYVREYLLIIN